MMGREPMAWQRAKALLAQAATVPVRIAGRSSSYMARIPNFAARSSGRSF